MTEQRTVLIVGDEDVFTELLGRMPATRYALAYAADPAEALEQLERFSPRVLVMALDEGGEQLRQLVSRAKAESDAVSVGLASSFDQPVLAMCDHAIIGRNMDQVSAAVTRFLGEGAASGEGRRPITSTTQVVKPPVEDAAVNALAERLQRLEQRLGEIARGTTSGLSELLQATDGLGQGLKLHARALKELEQRLEALGSAGPPAAEGEDRWGEERAVRHAMGEKLEAVAERLESLEGRLGEVALGTTGGLSELLQATDGLGQGIKAQARALGDLERRLQEVSARQSEWQTELATARAASREDSAPHDRLNLLLERVESLEGRVGEVALGSTGGLSELLQATDGLGQGIKYQARAQADLERRLVELEQRVAALEGGEDG